MVMNNTFPCALQPHVVYDLKGTTEDRWVNPQPGVVLKDRATNTNSPTCFKPICFIFPGDFLDLHRGWYCLSLLCFSRRFVGFTQGLVFNYLSLLCFSRQFPVR